MEFKSIEEELKYYKEKSIQLEFQQVQLTGSPMVVELDIPKDFEKRDFADCENEIYPSGRAKPIKTPELSEVDMSYFDGVNVMEQYVNLGSLHRENNRPLEDIQKMNDGTLSKGASSRATEITNTFRVFFGFCKRMFGKPDFRHLLDARVVCAFPTWYRRMGRQPSSTANHLKTIKAFLNYITSHKVFFNYVPKINQVIENLKPLHSVFSKEANSAKYLHTDERMRLLGTWLSEPEFLMLSKYVSDFLVDKFKQDEDFVSGKSDFTALSRADVALIMGHVYLLGLIYLGGQRNQFIASLSIKNVVFEGRVTKYLKTHEKVSRQKVDYFKFPLTFSVMLRVWMTKYLPLIRNDGVEACWVGSYGFAVKHSKMAESVAPIVALYFPGRNITPIYFRRAVVTFMKEKTFGTDASGVDSFFKERLAVLMNTSPDVIDKNYDRYHRADVNERTLNQVNEAIGLNPSDAVAAFVEKMAQSYTSEIEDFRKDATKILSHKFLASDIEFTVQFSDGVSKVLPGSQMSPLLHLVDIYWAQVGGPFKEALRLKLPKKWNHERTKSPKRKEIKKKDTSQMLVNEDLDGSGDGDASFGLDAVLLDDNPHDSSDVDLMVMVDQSKALLNPVLDSISKAVLDSIPSKVSDVHDDGSKFADANKLSVVDESTSALAPYFKSLTTPDKKRKESPVEIRTPSKKSKK